MLEWIGIFGAFLKNRKNNQRIESSLEIVLKGMAGVLSGFFYRICAPYIESNPIPTEASATPINSWYEKQTSGKAVAYGGAKLYQYGTYLGTLHLYLYLYGAGKKEVVVRSNFEG